MALLAGLGAAYAAYAGPGALAAEEAGRDRGLSAEGGRLVLGSGWGDLPFGGGRADLLFGGDAYQGGEGIVYYTPRVGGLRIGLAYAPDPGAADPLEPAMPGLDHALREQPARRALSADYLQRLGPVDLTVFGTYGGVAADFAPGRRELDLGGAWGLG